MKSERTQGASGQSAITLKQGLDGIVPLPNRFLVKSGCALQTELSSRPEIFINVGAAN
jgi:hypothetical protein